MNKPYRFLVSLSFLALAIGGLDFLRGTPPNIVVIVVDDLGYADLSFKGIADDVSTPCIDRLAKSGVRFTNAYATAPICNAARIALMSGRYQQRLGNFWYSGPGLHVREYPTIAELLKDSGYATGYIGKYHHGASDGVEGRGFPLNHGFDRFVGFSGGTKHYLRHRSAYSIGKDMLHQGPLWDQRKQRDWDGFTTEIFGAEARRFLRDHRDVPFYLHVSFNAVHNFTHQLPSDYLEAKSLEAFPDLKRGEDYWEWREGISYPAHPAGRDYYLGQLYFLDREIERLVDELESLGLEKNTAVIFTSDNGGSLVTYANNRPLKGGKYTLFEGGIRVPLILTYPELVSRDTVSNSVVSHLDLLPTICGITGIEAPAGIDGMNLLPTLNGRKTAGVVRDPLYWDTGHEMAIRQGKWKLLVTRRAPNPRLQITETPIGSFLYNLETDVGERNDLAAEYPQLVDRLTAELDKWRSDVSVEIENGPNRS